MEAKANATSPKRQESYLAFLRGINNIGSKTIKMDELKKIFETSGMTNVKTVSASGNVIFSTTKTELLYIVKNLENNLANKLGYKVSVLLRTKTEIEELVISNPFKQITITPKTKLYVTFISEKPKKKLKTPFESPDKDFKILRVTNNEIHSVVTLLPNKRPGAIMSFLEYNP
jgi:uncharacterized protein (DUF1697 family)